MYTIVAARRHTYRQAWAPMSGHYVGLLCAVPHCLTSLFWSISVSDLLLSAGEHWCPDHWQCPIYTYQYIIQVKSDASRKHLKFIPRQSALSMWFSCYCLWNSFKESNRVLCNALWIDFLHHNHAPIIADIRLAPRFFVLAFAKSWSLIRVSRLSVCVSVCLFVCAHSSGHIYAAITLPSSQNIRLVL